MLLQPTGCCARRSVCINSSGRMGLRLSSTSRTAIGSGSLRRSGFEIEDLIEVRPPETATTRYPFVTLDWAMQWPCEEVWKVRKRDRAKE